MNKPASPNSIVVDDSNSSIATLRHQDPNALFLRVLNVYNHHRLSNVKSHDFLSNLKCFLPIDSKSESDLNITWCERTEQARSHKTLLKLCSAPEEYAAVSYPWKASEGESNRKGGYQIVPNCSRVKVRDTVLDRTIRFIKYKQGDREMIPFWIDQLSIDQSDGLEKEKAMQSMDLVYKRCSYAIGHLWVEIQSQHQVNCLSDLMQGRMVKIPAEGEQPILIEGTTDLTARQVLKVLVRITEDNWWNRAWIFHEDYLAGTEMWLLIRHTSSLKKVPRCSLLGDLPDELVINSAAFRTYATLFGLAYRRMKDNESIKQQCNQILERAGRYSILHKQEPDYHTGRIQKTMTVSILKDLVRRDIKYKLDLLAITANTCGYGTWFSTIENRCVERSLSLSILALNLCNGEIIQSSKGENDLDKNIIGYLQDRSIGIDCPLNDGALTFIKHCRLHVDRLSSHGIHTTGTLWKFSEVIRPDCFLSGTACHYKNPSQRNIYHNRLDECQRSRLLDIVKVLYQRHPRRHRRLANDLTGFLDRYDTSIEKLDEWSPELCMDIMAVSLLRAIDSKKYIQLARPIGGKVQTGRGIPYRAIFVRDRHELQIPGPKFAFTSWSRTQQCIEDRREWKTLATYASLEVEVDGKTQDGLPVLKTKAWLNGLSFFNGERKFPFVFAWPESLMK